MATSLIPPLPTSVVPGSNFWNDWIEKLRTLVNGFAKGFPFSAITGKPTTLAGYGITDGQNISGKDAANGYAGLNSGSRITKGAFTTDDLIVNNNAKGLVLLAPTTGHYWRVTISSAGAIVLTDLGITPP